jgi:hypothetical protein
MTDTTFKTSTLAAHRDASSAKGETNDCTVKALAAATGESYDDAWAALNRHGRPFRKGPKAMLKTINGRRAIVCPALEKAANELGFDFRVMEKHEYRAKTMVTAERDPALRNGGFICMVRGHVAAVVDGEVIDWTEGRRHQVKEVYELKRRTATKAKSRKSVPMKAMTTFSQKSLF